MSANNPAEQLWTACSDRSGLPNPEQSFGCSPALRSIVALSGLQLVIGREQANDGDIAGHAGGNAVDVVGGHLPSFAAWLSAVPQLFACALHSPDATGDGLYVLDGQLVDRSTFAPQARTVYRSAMHLSSSWERLYAALRSAAVRSHLNAAITESAA